MCTFQKNKRQSIKKKEKKERKTSELKFKKKRGKKNTRTCSFNIYVNIEH